MTSLLDRDPTAEDLAAERDRPRPAVWAGEPGADLRALTQDETDALVRADLWSIGKHGADAAQLAAALGGQQIWPDGEGCPDERFREMLRAARADAHAGMAQNMTDSKVEQFKAMLEREMAKEFSPSARERLTREQLVAFCARHDPAQGEPAYRFATDWFMAGELERRRDVAP